MRGWAEGRGIKIVQKKVKIEILRLKLVAHKRGWEPPCKASLPCGAVVAHLQSNSSIATSTVDSIICEQLVCCTAQSLDRNKAQTAQMQNRAVHKWCTTVGAQQ